MLARSLPFLRMTSIASRNCGGRSLDWATTCAQPRMAFRGLRTSCERVTRKSS